MSAKTYEHSHLVRVNFPLTHVQFFGKVDVPVLVVHGAEDRYVPSRFSETLFDAVQGPKHLLLVPGANHNNSMRVGETAYLKPMRDLLGLPLVPV